MGYIDNNILFWRQLVWLATKFVCLSSLESLHWRNLIGPKGPAICLIYMAVITGLWLMRGVTVGNKMVRNLNILLLT